MLSAVKSIRNAAAHNNCTINDLKTRSTTAPQSMLQEVSQVPGIGRDLRQSRLSVRAIFEFISLLVLYDRYARGTVRESHIAQLQQLFFVRMLKHKEYFAENDLLASSYRFVAQIVRHLFGKEI